MATTTRNDTNIRFGKPSLTDLPYELGRDIIDQIINTPKPDFSDTEKEVRRVKALIRAQKKQDPKKV